MMDLSTSEADEEGGRSNSSAQSQNHKPLREKSKGEQNWHS